MTLTDERIKQLLTMSKRVTNRHARGSAEYQHSRRDYKAVATKADENFTIFIRQHAEMADNFSVGLVWHPRTGDDVILMRCNGASHRHRNHLEGTEFGIGNFHVHVATERYIEAAKNPEHYAEVTTDYSTLEGALHFLCAKCNISGLDTKPEGGSLFPPTPWTA